MRGCTRWTVVGRAHCQHCCMMSKETLGRVRGVHVSGKRSILCNRTPKQTLADEYEELVNKYAYKIFGQPFADSSREQAREVT